MRTELRRAVGLPMLLFYGVGTMVGGGFYALLGAVTSRAGMATPGAFLLAGLLALPTALSFAELAARFPVSAGEARYVFEGFGSRRFSTGVGLLVAATGVVSAATLSRAVGGFLNVASGAPLVAGALVTIVVLTALAAWGIGQSVLVVCAITVIEVGGLGLATALAPTTAAEVAGQASHFFLPGSDLGVFAWVGGGLLAFYAFVGFEDLVNLAEEVRDPRRTLPRALIGALAVTTTLYVVVSAVAVTAVPTAVLAESRSPLATLVGGSRAAPALTWIGVLAGVNGALVQLVMTARVLYGLACGGALPGAFARVNARTRTPVLATVVGGACASLLIAGLPLETLARLACVVLLVVFVLVNASLVRLHRRGPTPPGGPAVAHWVPVVGTVASAVALVFQVLAL